MEFPKLTEVLESSRTLVNSFGNSHGVPEIGTVFSLIDLVLGAGLAFAKAGKDPVVEIKKLLSVDPILDKVRAEWEDEIKKRFG